MRGGIEIGAQRELQQRYLRLGRHDLHRHEHAVVPAALVLIIARDPRRREQVRHPSPEIGRAGRVPATPIGVLWTTVIIVPQRRLRAEMPAPPPPTPMARAQKTPPPAYRPA